MAVVLCSWILWIRRLFQDKAEAVHSAKYHIEVCCAQGILSGHESPRVKFLNTVKQRTHTEEFYEVVEVTLGLREHNGQLREQKEIYNTVSWSGCFFAPLLIYWARKTAGGANVGVTVIARSFLKPISVRYGLEKVPNQNRHVLVIGSIQFFNDDTEFC